MSWQIPILLYTDGVARRAFQSGLVVIDRVEIVLVRRAVRRHVVRVPRAMPRERAVRRGAAVEGRLPTVRCFEPARGEREAQQKRSSTELMRIQESISTPGRTYKNFRVSCHFRARRQVPSKFKAAIIGCSCSHLLRRCAAVTTLRRRGRVFVIWFLGAAVSLEHVNNLAEEAFLFLAPLPL